mmetsp:Transcript_7946/g.33431  ORF Transcript_7946/g.33431 Transcript_7946/m.33431 type:complete len:200 (-) Transcript_7946:3002-3601(-)
MQLLDGLLQLEEGSADLCKVAHLCLHGLCVLLTLRLREYHLLLALRHGHMSVDDRIGVCESAETAAANGNVELVLLKADHCLEVAIELAERALDRSHRLARALVNREIRAHRARLLRELRLRLCVGLLAAGPLLVDPRLLLLEVRQAVPLLLELCLQCGNVGLALFHLRHNTRVPRVECAHRAAVAGGVLLLQVTDLLQ